MIKVGKASFNPKGCIDMTKDEFKAHLRSVNSKLVESAWKELQKEVKQYRPIIVAKPKAKKASKENEVKD